MKSCLQISALFVVVLLSGCRLHAPLHIAPLSPPPNTFSQATGKQLHNPVIAPWWQQFNDPALNQLEETLLTNNLAIKQAYARLKQLDAARRTTNSSLSPSLNLVGTANTGEQKNNTANLASNGQSISLAAGYELDLWQKLKSQRQAADLDLSASREDIKTLYLTLTSQAADLYFLAIEQRAQLNLTDTIIANLRTACAQVELRYRQGLVPSLDLYQAKQSLAAAKAKKPAQEAMLTATENSLAILLGHYPENNTLDQRRQLPAPPPAPACGIPATLLQQRPDVQSAFLRVQSNDARTAAAIADRFPALNLSASLGIGRTDSGLSIIHATFWNLIVGLTQPIIDGGRRQGEVARRQAITAEALARYQEVVLKAFQEVENGLVSNQSAAQQLALKDLELAAANATMHQANNGYRQGLNNYLVVLNAQRQHHEVERQLLSSRRQLLAARITLWRALGGNWLETSLHHNLSLLTNKDIDHEE